MSFKFLDSFRPPTLSVKHLIHKELAGWEEPRPHFPLRASDLMKDDYEFCPREHAFMDIGVALKKGQFIGTAQRITFDHGHYMEDQIRNNYLRGIAVGNWTCEFCNKDHANFGKAPKNTCECGRRKWKYKESRFGSDKTGVSGGIDFLIDVGQPKYRIIEVKTMAPDRFKDLAAPLAEHRERTSLYLYLAANCNWKAAERVNTQEATVLYVAKSFGFKDTSMKEVGIKDSPFSPFKEFVVKRNDEALKVPLAKATVLQNWRQNKQGMPCGICANVFAKRAQNCAAVQACFSGKYPSTLTWKEGKYPKHPGKVIASE